MLSPQDYVRRVYYEMVLFCAMDSYFAMDSYNHTSSCVYTPRFGPDDYYYQIVLLMWGLLENTVKLLRVL